MEYNKPIMIVVNLEESVIATSDGFEYDGSDF